MFGRRLWNFLSSFSSPGSHSGLKLVLNVEQYEHMRGPQNDAGVKVNNIL